VKKCGRKSGDERMSMRVKEKRAKGERRAKNEKRIRKGFVNRGAGHRVRNEEREERIEIMRIERKVVKG